jgi:hypothetical protein
MPTIDEFLNRASLDDLPVEHALNAVGQMIDHALDCGDLDLTNRALIFADTLEARTLSPTQQALLDYFRANAWANRRVVSRIDHANAWAWEQPEAQQQSFYLRRALNNPAFETLEEIRRCQILTNLANQLDTIGRFVESREYWTRALATDPDFWMARGNRGSGLIRYANALYDAGHRAVFGLYAHRDLLKAANATIKKPHLGDPALRPYFLERIALIESVMDPPAFGRTYRPTRHSLGDIEQERNYRDWCLRTTLFLNPLNDLEPKPIAARDVLHLPDFTTALDEPPVLIGFFNQIKQEYATSRWLYYNAMQESDPHFSDRNVRLYNTLDYPVYGLRVEQLKISFSMSYSLFDKIAFFLNRYMKLGISPNQVTFRGIWREKEGQPIRPQFEASENWPFRGLYWLSKDLFEAGFREFTEPDAQALHEVRRHLEHRYLKVHEMVIPKHRASGASTDLFFDTLAYSISRTDLERKALRLLKLARAALIYLSLGMHREELRRKDEHPSGVLASMPLTIWEDAWKR